MIGDGPAELGDVVRAYAVLRPDDPAAERIARLLGYQLTRRRTERVGAADIPRPADEPTTRPGSRRPVTLVQEGSVTTPPQDTDDGAPRTLPWRRYLRPVGRVTLQPQGGEEGLPVDEVTAAAPRVPEPLLRPSTAARMLEALVATDAQDGDIDLELMTAAIATRRTLTNVPRASRPTLLRGVQLLTDVSPAMAPYKRDADHVVAVLNATVGGARVRRLLFNGTPADGAGTGSAWGWSRYSPPDPSTPVLAVAELGLSGAPGRPVAELQDSWLELHRRLLRRGSWLTVLTPFHRSRWPRRLGSLDLVHWDRSSTVSTAQRLVRRRLAAERVRP